MERQTYKDLADKYHFALVNEVLEDTRRREHFYAEMKREHEQAFEWYKQLDEQERKDLPMCGLTMKSTGKPA